MFAALKQEVGRDMKPSVKWRCAWDGGGCRRVWCGVRKARMRTEGTSHPDRRNCRICRKTPADGTQEWTTRWVKEDRWRLAVEEGRGADRIDGGKVEISVLGRREHAQWAISLPA